MLKKTLLITIMLVMVLGLSAQAMDVTAGTEINENLDLKEEKTVIPNNGALYVRAESDKGRFGQDYLTITLFDTSGFGEKIVNKGNLPVDPNWSVYVMRPSLYPGEYKIKVETQNDVGYLEIEVIEAD
jgi:hypothetical protein